jgi:hypothetical protein
VTLLHKTHLHNAFVTLKEVRIVGIPNYSRSPTQQFTSITFNIIWFQHKAVFIFLHYVNNKSSVYCALNLFYFQRWMLEKFKSPLFANDELILQQIAEHLEQEGDIDDDNGDESNKSSSISTIAKVKTNDEASRDTALHDTGTGTTTDEQKLKNDDDDDGEASGDKVQNSAGNSTTTNDQQGTTKMDQDEGNGTLSANITPPALSSVPLNAIDDSLHPIYTNGCCGIGHRLSRVIPTIVYANRHGRKARVFWDDVPLSALFNDTDYVENAQPDKGWAIAEEQDLLIRNSHPTDWSGQPTKQYKKTGTVLDRYQNKEFFIVH